MQLWAEGWVGGGRGWGSGGEVGGGGGGGFAGCAKQGFYSPSGSSTVMGPDNDEYTMTRGKPEGGVGAVCCGVGGRGGGRRPVTVINR